MAQTITGFEKTTRFPFAGLYLVTAEIKLGTEYKAGGYVVSATLLKELGLPEGIVYTGYVNPLGLTETTALYSLNIDKPGSSTQTVLLQAYFINPATAKKPFKEAAATEAESSGQKLLLTVIGF